MSKTTFRKFPTELNVDYWPTLNTPPEDRNYNIRYESLREKQKRLKRDSQEMFLRDLRAAVPKGAILGLFFFSVIFSILPLLAFWLSNWHWVFPISGTIVLRILVGFNLTLLIMLVITFCLSLGTIVVQPIIPIFFICCGIFIRCIVEILPRKIF